MSLYLSLNNKIMCYRNDTVIAILEIFYKRWILLFQEFVINLVINVNFCHCLLFILRCVLSHVFFFYYTSLYMISRVSAVIDFRNGNVQNHKRLI